MVQNSTLQVNSTLPNTSISEQNCANVETLIAQIREINFTPSSDLVLDTINAVARI